MKTRKTSNNRAISILTLGVLMLAVGIILIYIIYTRAMSEHFENQNYKEFACEYMAENSEDTSLTINIFGSTGSAKPLEAARGVAACGLVLPMYQNNTGNITELLRNYSAAACEYGMNNSFTEITWIRSFPVNATNGDITYAMVAPSGPPGMNPCYLIWRINDTYVPRINLIGFGGVVAEPKYKNGTILQKVTTNIRMDFIRNNNNALGHYIEVWGMPS